MLILHCLTGILSTSNPWLAGFRQHTNGLLLSGVDLFFVLSGFLIGGILLDTKNKPHYFKIFWIKRVTRIFPVAYLMLATYAAAIFITDHFHITRFNNWLLAEYRPPLWTFATFTQSIPIAIHGYGGPRWMAMSWSLAIEDQFYLLFPLAVYFMPKKRLVALVIACLLIAPILRDVFLRIFGDWYAGYVLLPSRMDGIMYGVVLALILRNESAFNFVTRYRVLLDFIALFFLYILVMNWTLPWWPGMSTAIFPIKQSVISIMWGIAMSSIRFGVIGS